jgi:transcriptional regulator with XRE-family HTH domain
MAATHRKFDAILATEQVADPSFQAEWQRLAPAREFAATLLRYRADHKLSQRALAKKLGVSQPRVVKLESGEHNPEVYTIINAVRRLGIEFVLDVAPASRKPTLVTARAQKHGRSPTTTFLSWRLRPSRTRPRSEFSSGSRGAAFASLARRHASVGADVLQQGPHLRRSASSAV